MGIQPFSNAFSMELMPLNIWYIIYTFPYKVNWWNWPNIQLVMYKYNK